MSDATSKPRSPLPRIVIALGVVSLLTDVSSEMILPLLPALLLGTMGATPVAVGLLDGVADALSAVLKQLAGNLSDKAPTRKPFVLAGYTLSTITRPLVTFATAPWHAVMVRAVDRVGKGLRSAPRDALIADAVPPEDAPRAYAFHRMMDHTGAIVGPLVASGLLLLGFDARTAIAAAWVPGALAVLALFLFVKEKPRPASTVAPSSSSSSSSPPSSSPVPLPASLVALLVVVGVFSLGVISDSFLLVRARDLLLEDKWLPILWSVLHVAKVGAANVAGRMSLRTRGAVIVGWLVVAAGIGALLVDDLRVVWIAALILGAGHGLREPVEKALVRAAAPDAARGRAFGAYHLVTGLMSLPSGLAIGEIWERWHGPTALMASCVVVVAAALGLALLPRR